MRLPRLLPLALASGLLALTACGGGDGGGAPPEGADIAPADVALYVVVDTDFDGEQWQNAEALLGKFPSGGKVTEMLQESLNEDAEEPIDFEQDVKPALGPELNVACLTFEEDANDCVGWTKPDDRAKLDALFEKSGEETVTAEVDDWVVFAETQEVLDRFTAGGDDASLADADAFEDAMDGLPEEALGRMYLSGSVLTEEARADPDLDPRVFEAFFEGGEIPSLGFALAAEEEGARFEMRGRADTEEEPETYEDELDEELPAGALAYLSFNNLASSIREGIRTAGEAEPEFDRGLAQVELGLGVSIQEDLLPLFEGEGALAVYPGAESQLASNQPAGLPTIVLVLAVDDEEQARETADTIASRAQALADGVEVRETEIGGVAAKEVVIGPAQTSVLYAVFDGKLVVTSTEEGILGLREEGEKLADDDVFTSAREAAEMPDESAGFAYVNLAEGIPFVTELSQQTQGEQIPPEAQENLEPLESLLLFGSFEEGRFRLAGFLGVE